MSEQDRIAFEKWHEKEFGAKPSFNRDHEGSSHWDGDKQDREQGWNAATTEAYKLIAELKSEVAYFKQVREQDKSIVLKAIQLQASNQTLREALIYADEFIRNGVEFGYVKMPDDDLMGIDSAHDTPEIIRKALSATPSNDCQYGKDVGMPEYTCVGKCQYAATPAESLQAHDDEVIEMCAKVCIAKANELKELIDQDCIVGKADTGAIVCAQEIRALKGKQ